MLEKIKAWRRCGALEPYAWHFATLVARLSPAGRPDPPDYLLLAAALVAQATVARKNICLELAPPPALGELLRPEASGHDQPPDIELPGDLAQRLASQECACAVAVNPRQEPPPPAPLVLEGARLYLQRYWLMENSLARELSARSRLPQDATPTERQIRDCTRLHLDPGQVKAIRQAVSRRLCIVTGGPGSGKTTIVGVMLTLLLAERPDMAIGLCAPTGKAQARLKEALEEEIAHNLLLEEQPELRHRLQALETTTIHRLLRPRPPLGTFTANATNPLKLDLLVVDEASMIDLDLMHSLLSALPQECRLVMLGDSDQLAAVETGALLADICAAWDERPGVARLSHSHRFRADSGIGALKEAINRGLAESAWSCLVSAGDTTLSHADAPRSYEECARRLEAFVREHSCRAYLSAKSPAEAFTLFDSFRVLCATRRGPCGVDHVNNCLLSLLKVKPYGHGYPVMVTVNDYARRLFNGDTGLCLKQPGDRDTLVYFPDPELPGGFRAFKTSELPEHAPAFALTVHKAQGSGFDQLLLMLPHYDSPVLTRELLYTGITRARQKCTLWSDREIFMATAQRQVRRMSGLGAKLTVG